MTNKHYTTETFTQREGAFRFGGQVTLDNLRQEYYRDVFANFLCRGLVEEAIKGFDLVDNEGRVLDWNDDFQEIIEEQQFIPEIIRGFAMERRDGKSLLLALKGDQNLILRSFTRRKYEPDYNKFGELKAVEAQSKIAGRSVETVHDIAGSNIKRARELILRRREEVNEGMSYLEPVWDYLIALYFLVSHSAYYMARVGAGVKKVKQSDESDTPVDPVTSDTVEETLDRLTEWGSANDVMWVPPGIEVEMDDITGAINFSALFDIYLAIISAYSGVPQSRLKGLVPGQLTGAEVNEESYFDVLRDIQHQTKPTIKWFVKQVIEYYEIGSDEFNIRFNVREEMSELNQTQLDMAKMDLAEKYMSNGMVREDAYAKAGINIDNVAFEEDKDELDDEGGEEEPPFINPESEEDESEDEEEEEDEDPDE